MPTTSGLRQ